MHGQSRTQSNACDAWGPTILPPPLLPILKNKLVNFKTNSLRTGMLSQTSSASKFKYKTWPGLIFTVFFPYKRFASQSFDSRKLQQIYITSTDDLNL